MEDKFGMLEFTVSQCEWLKKNLFPKAPFNITYKVANIYTIISIFGNVEAEITIIITGNTSTFARVIINDRIMDANATAQWDIMNTLMSDKFIMDCKRFKEQTPYAGDDAFTDIKRIILSLH